MTLDNRAYCHSIGAGFCGAATGLSWHYTNALVGVLVAYAAQIYMATGLGGGSCL